MVVIFSWIKKELAYLKDSFFEIIKSVIIVILASSGFGCALLLRYQGFNGTIITFISLLVEFIALILCYLMLRGYLKSGEEVGPSKPKGKRKEKIKEKKYHVK